MKEDVQVTSEVDEEIHITRTAPFRSSTEEGVHYKGSKSKFQPTMIVQKLSPSEFNTAMVHFYRGEIQRSNVWRSRLDTTTNWAVITTGATLSFVFSSPDNPHFVIPINTILVAIFMFMEARRYRYYEVWANRVRILESGYFAPMLSSRAIPPDREWAEHLSADLLSPHFTISEWEAIGRRLRRNYIWIFVLLALSWTLKVYLHPYPIASNDPRVDPFEVFLERASVGLAPGWLVILVGVIFNSLIFFIAIATLKLHDASSEVMPSEKFEWHPLKKIMQDWANFGYRTIRRAKRAQQRLQSIEKTQAPNL